MVAGITVGGRPDRLYGSRGPTTSRHFTAKVVGFGDTMVFVNHPQGIQELLTSDRKTFLALGSANGILAPLLGDYSIIMLDGDRHKRRRQLLMPPFHGERMRAYGQLISALTTTAFDQLPLNRPFSARIVTQEISLQIILQVVFGLTEGSRCQELKVLLASLLDLFRSPLTSSFLFFPVLQKDLGAWSPGENLFANSSKLMIWSTRRSPNAVKKEGAIASTSSL